MSSETTSLFSSIAEAPAYLEQQYSPLREAFREHCAELPDQRCPEPNSEAMVKALKALQEKIRGLELDRVMAVEKFNHLSDETERCGQLLQNGDRSLSPSAYLMSTTGRESYDLQGRLNGIDVRLGEQAHELSDMKGRLHEAEAAQQQGVACSQKLERQHKELQQHQKNILHHLSKAGKTTSSGVGKRSQQKQRSTAAQSTVKTASRKKNKSASPSHSVTANYQQVLASMKSHSPLLCGAAAASKKMQAASKRKTLRQRSELKSLLTGLEEEFGRLTFEHQELAEQLKRLRSEPSKIQDHTTQWEKQLELLIVQMEAKRKQIRIVSRQLQGGPRKASVVYCHKSQELMNPRATSLTFLQNMKTIQKTLRQDDLSWD